MQAAALVLAAILLIALDQVTKAFVVYRLEERQAITFGSLAIRRVRNQRACVAVLGAAATLTAICAARHAMVEEGCCEPAELILIHSRQQRNGLSR
jgi:hypothetical protein